VIYLDTNYLVRLYWADPGFETVRELAASDHVACALHGQAELVAAFHRKLREGIITLKSFRALLAQFETDHKAGAFQWLPSSPEVLQRVRDVYAGLPGSVYLRGADALHLATAALNGFGVVYSNDAHLLAAAGNFGLKGVNIIRQP
jgi:predicted nucleic acid-binding protein